MRSLKSNHLTGASIVLAVASFLGLSAQACLSTQHKAIVRSVLSEAETVCVLVDEKYDDEHLLARACNIAEDYIPAVRVLMQAKKQAASHKLAVSQDASVVCTDDTAVVDSRKD